MQTKSMKLEIWPIERITPYERNSRLNEAAVDAVAESIRQFGIRQPIVVDVHGVIVCGHTRLRAALKLGLKRVPVHVARDLSAKQIRAYRIADNSTHDRSEWDLDALTKELIDLKPSELDWTALGFSPECLADLLEPATSPEKKLRLQAPESFQAVTQEGDEWRLGRHRLFCLDSRGQDPRGLCDRDAELMIFDPPFNAAYNQWGLPTGVRVVAVFGRGSEALRWMASEALAGFRAHELVIVGEARGIFNAKLPCCVHDVVHVWRRSKDRAVLDCCRARAIGLECDATGRPLSVQHCSAAAAGKPRGGGGYGKPFAIMSMLCCYAPRRGVVWDPTCAGGTSILAAEATERTAVACEIDPRMCDEAVGWYLANHDGIAVCARGRKRLRYAIRKGTIRACPDRSRARQHTSL